MREEDLSSQHVMKFAPAGNFFNALKELVINLFSAKLFDQTIVVNIALDMPGCDDGLGGMGFVEIFSHRCHSR